MALSTTQSFEGSATMKLVLDTHHPDGHKVDVRPLLDVIDNIFLRATPSIDGVLTGAHENGLLEDKSNPASNVAFGELANVLHKVSCEIGCKCSGAHATTMEILKTLSSYSWDVKAVLTIAAFAVNYGEFGLFAQLYSENPLAKYIALLKQLPEIIEHGSALKPQFDAVTTLVGAVMELTKCIVEFNDLNPRYVSPDKPPMSIPMADVHKHVYLIIFSVVACATQIASLTGFSTESQPTFSISNLAVKVDSNLKILRIQLDTCKKYVVEQKQKEEYEKIVNVFRLHKQDKILISILGLDVDDDSQTLVDSTGKKVEIDIFLQKTVLILISDLDITKEEITALATLCKGWKIQKQRQIVWLPIVDKSNWDRLKLRFDEIRSSMPWYTVKNPLLIKSEVIQYIKTEWNFSKKTILVPLNQKGEVQSTQSLNMMWIWGHIDLPLTDDDEKNKWQKQISPLDLIFGGIDNTSLSLINKGETTVCFYGGSDIEWIKRFVTVAKKVAEVSGTAIELVYVGKRNAIDRAKKNVDIINAQKLSRSWTDTSTMWLFWTRLESIFHTKTRININDNIMQEIITLLAFDASEKGWAMFYKGSSMARAKGDVDVVLGELLRNEEWVKNAKNKDMVASVDGCFQKLQTKHCNKFSFDWELQGELPCYCGRTMKKYYTYSCCVDN